MVDLVLMVRLHTLPVEVEVEPQQQDKTLVTMAIKVVETEEQVPLLALPVLR